MLNQKPSDVVVKNTRPQLEEDTYASVITGLAYLGTQLTEDFDTKKEIQKQKVMVFFEFPTETFEYEDKDGNVEEVTHSLIKEYNFSTHEKAALMELYGSTCKGEDTISDILGKGCLVATGTTKTGNAKVVGTVKLTKGATAPEPTRDTFLIMDTDFEAIDTLNLEGDDIDRTEEFENVPVFLLKKIQDRVGD